MSRLQLLNANADKSMLSTDEAKAVASHLIANVPQVSAADEQQFIIEIVLRCTTAHYSCCACDQLFFLHLQQPASDGCVPRL